MSKSSKLFEKGADTVGLVRWRRRANAAPDMPRSELHRQSERARALRMQLDTILRTSEDRLALPREGSDSFQQQRGSDWGWRADAWRWRSEQTGHASVGNGGWIGPELQVFHDCPLQEISVRQMRNTSERDMSPYSMRFDVFGFEGSFLSVVMGLPDNATQGLRKNHLVRMTTMIEAERDIEMFARLNVQHGPNTEQFVRELQVRRGESSVEFDMSDADLNENRIDRMWVDLIFENPAMNQVTIRDLTFSRSPRAEI